MSNEIEKYEEQAKSTDPEKVISATIKLKKNLKKIWKEIKYLIDVITIPGIPVKDKLIAITVLLYVINPFDVIPDWTPYAGYIDDAAVVLAGVGAIVKRHGTDLTVINKVEEKQPQSEIKIVLINDPKPDIWSRVLVIMIAIMMIIFIGVAISKHWG